MLFSSLTFKGLSFTFSSSLSSACCGAVAQLGERLNGIQEVVGSTPIGSTNLRSGWSFGWQATFSHSANTGDCQFSKSEGCPRSLGVGGQFPCCSCGASAGRPIFSHSANTGDCQFSKSEGCPPELQRRGTISMLLLRSFGWRAIPFEQWKI